MRIELDTYARKCSQNLKRSHQCDSKDSKFGNKINEHCICTCCRSTFMRRQVVLFEKKNYDFKNKSVDTALSKNFWCKKSIHEFICKMCHRCLLKRRDVFSSIPQNAFCRSSKYAEKSSNDSGSNGKINDKKCNQGHLNWNNTLAEMGHCSNFEDLVKYVDRLGELPVLDKNFKGLRQINTDRRDFLTFESIPVDVGVFKEDLFPVFTSGAGS